MVTPWLLCGYFVVTSWLLYFVFHSWLLCRYLMVTLWLLRGYLLCLFIGYFVVNLRLLYGYFVVTFFGYFVTDAINGSYRIPLPSFLCGDLVKFAAYRDDKD